MNLNCMYMYLCEILLFSIIHDFATTISVQNVWLKDFVKEQMIWNKTDTFTLILINLIQILDHGMSV